MAILYGSHGNFEQSIVFHHMMCQILKYMLHKCVKVCMDDCMFFAIYEEAMFQLLEKVNVFREANIKLNGAKCEFSEKV